jgi:crotonobetainyl-CoA:carnitine CoA-transferase CaiB-like acyl-CoA transferase
LNHLPLRGLRVFEIAGGAAAAYCGRLLVDAGATVTLVAPGEAQLRRSLVRIDPAPSSAGADQAEAAYAGYLMAGVSRHGS